MSDVYFLSLGSGDLIAWKRGPYRLEAGFLSLGSNSLRKPQGYAAKMKVYAPKMKVYAPKVPFSVCFICLVVK